MGSQFGRQVGTYLNVCMMYVYWDSSKIDENSMNSFDQRKNMLEINNTDEN